MKIKSKKFLAAAVCAAVCLTTACGNSGSVNFSGSMQSTPVSSTPKSSAPAQSTPESSTPESSAPASSTPASSTPESSAPVQSTPESSAPASSAPAASTPVSENQFVHGAWNGNTYTSEFFGVTITLPSDWGVSAESALASANGIADMSAENLNKRLEESGMIYEMMATTSAGRPNINMTIENLAKSNGGKTVTPEAYVDAVLTHLPDTYKAMGAENSSAEKTQLEISGKKLYCAKGHLTVNGIEMYQYQVPFVNNLFVGCLTITVTSDEELQTVISGITLQ